MIIKIEHTELEKIYRGIDKGKSRYSFEVKQMFIKTLLKLERADNIIQIRKFAGLNFEALKGDLKGKYSVRVNEKYRIILRIDKDEILIEDVLVIEDLTNHYKKFKV